MSRCSTTRWVGVIAANFLFTVAAAAQDANPQDAKPRELNPEALRCRAAIAKRSSKLVARGARTLADCHRGRDAGEIPPEVDCNVLSTLEADSSGRFASSRAKFLAAVTRSCTGVDGLLVTPGFFTSCPEPCGSELSIPNPMTTLAQVGDCLACTAAEVVEGLSATTLGLPDPSTLGVVDAKCRRAIARGYQEVLSSAHRAELACQRRADAEQHWDVAGCVDEDASGKVASGLAKAEAVLEETCGEAVLASLDSCDDDTLAGLRSCNASAWDAAGDATFIAAHELPATICPSALHWTVRAGCSTNSIAGDVCATGGGTGSSLSLGWTGFAHDGDVLDQVRVPLALECPGAEAGACGDCEILGIDAGDASAAGFVRCEASPWIPCDEPFANDSDCGGGRCATFLSPPLPVSGGGVPLCTLNRLSSDVTGTADPDDGGSELFLDVRARVYNGIGQTQPCPICEHDTTPQDGVTSGTCKGGDRHNQPCDVQAFDLSFAPTDEEHPTSGPSLDCPPSVGANISGSGLRIPLPLTTGTASLPFGDSCDSPNETESCACGVCSHDNTVSCNGDAECDLLSAGSTCQKGSSGASRSPNSCTSFACETVGGATDRGRCADPADTQKTCSGALRARGEGILPCEVDADCDVFSIPGAGVCPGDDCGTCSLQTRRSCFLDPVETTGTADAENPVLAGLFCVPPTGGAGRNSVLGLPGPGELNLDAIVTPVY